MAYRFFALGMTWLVMLFLTVRMSAQFVVDEYNDDGSRYVCSSDAIFYDNFFHTARFAVAANADSQGVLTFQLQVTYDEGWLEVEQGDTLELVLRGGSRVILTTDRAVSRGDMVKRHYLDHNDYYVTCYYPLTVNDIQRLCQVRTTKITVRVRNYTFDRRIDHFQDRFTRLFTAIYAHTLGQSNHTITNW